MSASRAIAEMQKAAEALEMAKIGVYGFGSYTEDGRVYNALRHLEEEVRVAVADLEFRLAEDWVPSLPPDYPEHLEG